MTAWHCTQQICSRMQGRSGTTRSLSKLMSSGKHRTGIESHISEAEEHLSMLEPLGIASNTLGMPWSCSPQSVIIVPCQQINSSAKDLHLFRTGDVYERFTIWRWLISRHLMHISRLSCVCLKSGLKLGLALLCRESHRLWAELRPHYVEAHIQ